MGRGAQATTTAAAARTRSRATAPLPLTGTEALAQGRFVHVAPAAATAQIRDHGLVAAPDRNARRFNVPVYDNAVYVWSTAKNARDWQSRLADMGAGASDQQLWETHGVNPDLVLPDSEMFADTVMRRLSDDFFERLPFGTNRSVPMDEEQEEDPLWHAQAAAADRILADRDLAEHLGAFIKPHLDEDGMMDFTALSNAGFAALDSLTPDHRRQITAIYAEHDLALMVIGGVPSDQLRRIS
jgi:hypothetical protein